MTGAIHIRSISSVSEHWSGVNAAETSICDHKRNWFDAVTFLGRKGHKFLSTPTKYMLSAFKQSENFFDGGNLSGIYIGSSSADTEHRKAITSNLRCNADELPGAASALSASLNASASCIAKLHGVRGPVLTLAGGDDTGLICLWSAAIAAARGEIASICIGQVEHQPHELASDGAVVWLASSEDCDDVIAKLEVEEWKRFDPDNLDTLITAVRDCTGPVTVLSAYAPTINAEIQEKFREERPEVEVDLISTRNIEGLIVKDLRPFSMLSLMILRNFEGRLLVLSENGHLFKLKLTKKRT